MSIIIGKILLSICVGLVFAVGFSIRPQARGPIAKWQVASVFVIGLIIGVVMLTTHALYISGKA